MIIFNIWQFIHIYIYYIYIQCINNTCVLILATSLWPAKMYSQDLTKLAKAPTQQTPNKIKIFLFKLPKPTAKINN